VVFSDDLVVCVVLGVALAHLVQRHGSGSVAMPPFRCLLPKPPGADMGATVARFRPIQVLPAGLQMLSINVAGCWAAPGEDLDGASSATAGARNGSDGLEGPRARAARGVERHTSGADMLVCVAFMQRMSASQPDLVARLSVHHLLDRRVSGEAPGARGAEGDSDGRSPDDGLPAMMQDSSDDDASDEAPPNPQDPS